MFWLILLSIILVSVLLMSWQLQQSIQYQYKYSYNMQEGGAPNLSLQFSGLNQDISQGNNISYSKIVNPLASRDQFLNNCNKPSYVYFGSPNPLMHQMKPMAIPKDTMFYFANAVSSPACCPSTYSTSSGCVCTFPKNIYPCKNELPYEPPIPGPNSWQ